MQYDKGEGKERGGEGVNQPPEVDIRQDRDRGRGR